jgi:transposase InsO family protein
VPCCTYHRGQLPRAAPLQPIIPGAPFERLSIDLTGPHCRSDRGHIWILTAADPFTKWTEAFPLRNKEAETVAKVLVDQVFARFGTPIALLSDRGKEVDSSIMRAVCRLLDIDKMRTTAYKPSTNSAIERFHRTMNAMLGKVVAEHQRDWDLWLPSIMAAYRASRHDVTGYSANYLMLGRETRAPVDLVYGTPDCDVVESTYDGYVEKLRRRQVEAYRLVRTEIGHAAERNKRYYDLRCRKRPPYEVGEWVYYYNPRHYQGRQDKWCRKYTGPYLVVEILPPVNVKLQRSPRAKPFICHIDKVKRAATDDLPRSWLPSTTTAGDSQLPAGSPDRRSPTERRSNTPSPPRDINDTNEAGEEQPAAEPLTPSRNNAPRGGGSPQQTPSQDPGYEVDEGPQPRPRRAIRLPARFRD